MPADPRVDPLTPEALVGEGRRLLDAAVSGPPWLAQERVRGSWRVVTPDERWWMGEVAWLGSSICANPAESRPDRSTDAALIVFAVNNLGALLDAAEALPRLTEALEEIEQHAPEVESLTAEQVAEMDSCPTCKWLRDKPGSVTSHCSEHYMWLTNRDVANERNRSNEHVYLKRIAREALAALHPVPQEPMSEERSDG